MSKTFIGTSGGPKQIRKLWIGTGGYHAQQLKKVWVGTENGPKQIFGDLLSEAIIWIDASQEINAGNQASQYTNWTNGAVYPIQLPWGGLGLPTTNTWNYGAMNDFWANGNSNIPGPRPVSFNTERKWGGGGHPPPGAEGYAGRGGTIRLTTPIRNATMMIIARVDGEQNLTPGPVFYNQSFFNSAGSYQVGDDYCYYSGEEISRIQWGGSVPHSNWNWNNVGSVDGNGYDMHRRLSITTMIVNENIVTQRLRTRTTPTLYGTLSWPGRGIVQFDEPRKSQANIQDVRFYDGQGGGIISMRGELYQALCFDRALDIDEVNELEDYFMNERYPNLI